MKKVFLVLIVVLSCKSTEKISKIQSETVVEKDSLSRIQPEIELSAGTDIVIQDVKLEDFNEFKVWVTTKSKDTIGNCKLKKVTKIKGIEEIPHFFIKFQSLPIVYKMKVENNQLVFANTTKSKSN